MALRAFHRLIERLRPTSPEAALKEKGIERDETGTGQEDDEGFGDEVDVVFVAAMLAIEAVGEVDGGNGDEHVDDEGYGAEPGEEAEEDGDAAEELAPDGHVGPENRRKDRKVDVPGKFFGPDFENE